ncbi:FIST N-terminal domain-containing protein [Paracoccus benzoatiresistens]|uniref:FIST C-terminal domain-containing protein n=1 Tax=Paracoccus benzoatiresistens TaxID=2997341 RepID=A0ABT4J6E8_9RHOB|nr:FIST N-terminal domain-containing protein [Paracoccus sp. EF6]MCZ0962021.1 FIST C-terminal domain-containing protein [Paracoccus sp. EF6]
MNTGPAAKEGATGPVAVQADRGQADHGLVLLDGLRGANPGLVLVFGAHGPELSALDAVLRSGLPQGCVIAGCSSAGEIGPGGYASDSIVAIGFPSAHFRAEAMVLPRLDALPVSDWMASLRALQARFDPGPDRAVFGLLLVDGLAGQEDALVATIDAALPSVPTLGGSAGDGLFFRQTWLLAEGKVITNAAVFLMVETDLAVSEITFAHFSPTETRVVVTDAIPEKRRILELNAEPAAEEYARLTGTALNALTPAEFARHPLLLRTGRHHHVRAISALTSDGGLSLMSAIDTGTVLTLGRAEDMTQGFAEALASLPRPPLMILGFDCILRRLAVEREGLRDRMSELLAHYRVAGFNTYGEQHSGMHVNQTFVGLAFMPQPPDETRAEASDAA